MQFTTYAALFLSAITASAQPLKARDAPADAPAHIPGSAPVAGSVLSLEKQCLLKFPGHVFKGNPATDAYLGDDCALICDFNGDKTGIEQCHAQDLTPCHPKDSSPAIAGKCFMQRCQPTYESVGQLNPYP